MKTSNNKIINKLLKFKRKSPFALRLSVLLVILLLAGITVGCIVVSTVPPSAHRAGPSGAGSSSSLPVSTPSSSSSSPGSVPSSSSSPPVSAQSSTPSASVPRKASPEDFNYFNDAVFVGDSLTEDMLGYPEMDHTTMITSIGASTYKVLTDHQLEINNNKEDRGWIPDRVAAKKPKKIYVMLGMNDLCWGSGMSKAQFLQYYGGLIDALRGGCPDAKIYIQSITPMAASAENGKDWPLDNVKINDYNAAIQSMCAAKGLQYLNVASVLKGPDGKLPASFTDDGVHLRSKGYELWFDYLVSNE